jgi:hypothetical protein
MERKRNHKEDPIPSFLALLAVSLHLLVNGEYIRTCRLLFPFPQSREREREAHTQSYSEISLSLSGTEERKRKPRFLEIACIKIDSILPFLDFLRKNALKRKQTLSVLVLFKER